MPGRPAIQCDCSRPSPCLYARSVLQGSDTHLYFHQYVKDRSILLCKHFSFRPVLAGVIISPPCRYARSGLPMRSFFRLHPQNRPFRQNCLQLPSDARRLSLDCEKGVWDCLCHFLHSSPLVRAYYLRWHTLDGQTCLYASLGHAPCADWLAIEQDLPHQGEYQGCVLISFSCQDHVSNILQSYYFLLLSPNVPSRAKSKSFRHSKKHSNMTRARMFPDKTRNYFKNS